MRYLIIILILISFDGKSQTLTISKRENIDTLYLDKHDSVHIAFNHIEYPFQFFFYQAILSHAYCHYAFNVSKIEGRTYYSTKLNYHSGINQFYLVDKPQDTTKTRTICSFEVGDIVLPVIDYKIKRNKIIFNIPVFYEYQLSKPKTGKPFDISLGGFYYNDTTYIPKRFVQGIVQGYNNTIIIKDLPKGEHFIWVQSLGSAIVIKK
jgi:hypothetical protein